MPQLRLSARARADVERLHGFLSAKDGEAAKRAVRAIQVAFNRMAIDPGLGRPVDEHPGLREWVVAFGATGYLALYRVEPHLNAVTVLAIKHQRESDYR